MSDTIEYNRPSGVTIKVANNEDTIAYAKSMGWKRVEAVKVTRPRKIKD